VDDRLAQPGWWQALSGAAIALAVDALYLVILWGEGEGELTSARVIFVAGCIVGAATALIWALTLEGRKRAIVLTAAAAMLVVWTLLGALSIGILLAPAAVFAVLAASAAGSVSRSEVALAAAAPVVLAAAGLVLT
jgi:hypothetical protein